MSPNACLNFVQEMIFGINYAMLNIDILLEKKQ